MKICGALDFGGEERVEIGVPGSRADIERLICAEDLEVVTADSGKIGCIAAVDGEGAPDVVCGIVNGVGVEVDGTGDETSTTIND